MPSAISVALDQIKQPHSLIRSCTVHLKVGPNVNDLSKHNASNQTVQTDLELHHLRITSGPFSHNVDHIVILDGN